MEELRVIATNGWGIPTKQNGSEPNGQRQAERKTKRSNLRPSSVGENSALTEEFRQYVDHQSCHKRNDETGNQRPRRIN